MPQIGPLEILVILIVALVVFGPGKLPQIGRQVGRGMHELRKFQSSIKDDIEGAFRGDDDDDAHAEPGADDHPKSLDGGDTAPSKPDVPEADGPDAAGPDSPKPESSKPESKPTPAPDAPEPEPGTRPEPPAADSTS